MPNNILNTPTGNGNQMTPPPVDHPAPQPKSNRQPSVTNSQVLDLAKLINQTFGKSDSRSVVQALEALRSAILDERKKGADADVSKLSRWQNLGITLLDGAKGVGFLTDKHTSFETWVNNYSRSINQESVENLDPMRFSEESQLSMRPPDPNEFGQIVVPTISNDNTNPGEAW